MVKLLVQEKANAQGLTLSALHAKVIKVSDRNVPLGTIRRYWYGTRDGSIGGPALDMVSLSLLHVIAKALGVRASELVNDESLGPNMPAVVVRPPPGVSSLPAWTVRSGDAGSIQGSESSNDRMDILTRRP